MLLTIATAALTLCACAAEPASDTTVTAFVDVAVVPMTGGERVLRGQTVVVRGDRITEVGPSGRVRVPSGARRVEGRGKWLIPGLAEMHGHIPPPNAPPEYTESVLFLYLANGITTVRGMLGYPNQLELRERARRGDLLAPNLYLAGPSFNGNSVSSPEQAAQMARTQKADGWDLLKVHPGLTLAEYDAMARASKEVGIRFGGHVPEEVGLLHALEMGQETFDHVDGYAEYLNAEAGPVDAAKLADVVRRTREAGAWIVPTMALWEVLYNTTPLATLQAYPELRYAPQQQVRSWVNAYSQRAASPQYNPVEAGNVIAGRTRILRALHEGGARILMGTDAPQQFSVPGFSLHRELKSMAAAGMSPYDILATGTRNSGEYFKERDTFGAIAPAQRADLVLLDADPLADVANFSRISGVMVRGRWLPKSEIDARLERIAAGYRTPPPAN